MKRGKTGKLRSEVGALKTLIMGALQFSQMNVSECVRLRRLTDLFTFEFVPPHFLEVIDQVIEQLGLVPRYQTSQIPRHNSVHGMHCDTAVWARYSFSRSEISNFGSIHEFSNFN